MKIVHEGATFAEPHDCSIVHNSIVNPIHIYKRSDPMFAYIVVDCIRNGAPTSERPWYSAKGLEWTLSSPAAYHSFNTPPSRAEILEESQHS